MSLPLALLVLLRFTVSASGAAVASHHPVKPMLKNHHDASRITNGEECDVPYQCYLLYDQGLFCGCSLVSPSHVLTAGHCGQLGQRPRVTLGAHYFNTEEPGSLTVVAANTTVHDKFDPETLENDLALVTLPEPVQMTEGIQSVVLGASEVAEGAAAMVSGWGRVSDSTSGPSPTLQCARSTVLSNSQCRREFGPFIYLPDTCLCLDGSGLRGSCNGDSGGPLVVPRPGAAPLQVGLVSFGASLGCEEGYPSAFTRLFRYRDWIDEQTLGGVQWEPL